MFLVCNNEERLKRGLVLYHPEGQRKREVTTRTGTEFGSKNPSGAGSIDVGGLR